MNSRQGLALALLLVGLLLNLVTPAYNRVSPTLGGLPFFYWFQTFLLLLVTFIYLGAAYLLREREEGEKQAAGGGGKP